MEWVIYGNSTAYGDSFAAGIGGVSAVENTYVKTGYLRVYKESGYGPEYNAERRKAGIQTL